MSNLLIALVVYFCILAVASVICFLVYRLDKRRAVSGGQRVSERTLHVLAFLGGWPGALLAQRNFRHKTKKLSFLLVFWLVALLHIAIVGAAGYVYLRSLGQFGFVVKAFDYTR